jgi:glycine/D-amino acid oxidase-like deaminating enzyme
MIAGDVYHKLERKRLSGLIFPAVGGIVTTAPLGDVAKAINPHDLAVYDCRFVLDYYRLTADGRLLFGGGPTIPAANPAPLPTSCARRSRRRSRA